MAIIVDDVEHVTAAEAAAELKTTPLRVLMLVKEQVLAGRQLHDQWIISRSSLECAKVHGIARPAGEASCRTSCSGSGCGCR